MMLSVSMLEDGASVVAVGADVDDDVVVAVDDVVAAVDDVDRIVSNTRLEDF